MSILEQAIVLRDQAHAARGLLLDGAAAEHRGLHDWEESKYLDLGTKHAELVARDEFRDGVFTQCGICISSSYLI